MFFEREEEVKQLGNECQYENKVIKNIHRCFKKNEKIEINMMKRSIISLL